MACQTSNHRADIAVKSRRLIAGTGNAPVGQDVEDMRNTVFRRDTDRRRTIARQANARHRQTGIDALDMTQRFDLASR